MAGTLSITSYNLHGLFNRFSLLTSLCKNYDIVLVQEHRLPSSVLCKLSTLDRNFDCCAVSSMDAKSCHGPLTGRPFGGVAILWNKKLSPVIEVVGTDTEGRGLSVRLRGTDNKSIVLTCVLCLFALS